MSYTVKFSDSAKINEAIVVEDAGRGSLGLNSDATSLTFVGKNAANYAEAISTNFLHLLEHFANSIPPTNPIEGQIWFDTSDETNKKLKINDGTAAGGNWKPINGVYQQDVVPNTASSGDIWVDTARAQLFLTLDGNSWTLVGPSISSELRTGSIPEQIKDIYGNLHNIVTNYIDGIAVEIITNESFTPQIKIEGFETLQAGVNLAEDTRLVGRAYASENLYVTSPARAYVSANSFVRNDIDNSINGKLNLRNGITLGQDPTFLITKEGTRENIFYNSYRIDGQPYASGKFSFKILKDDLYNEALTIDGTNQNIQPRVGINNVNPTRELDIVGDVLVTGSLEVTNAFTVTNRATFSSSVVLQTSSTFESTASFKAGLLLGTGSETSAVDFILPATPNRLNIGNSYYKFKEIHSTDFYGELTGQATSATMLSGVSDFVLSGEIASNKISYKGQSGTYTFITSIQPTAISSKSAMTSVADADEILVSAGPSTYNFVSASGGSGADATFNITRSNGVYTVTTGSTGTGYQASETLIISGTELGGSTANNITIQITTVNTSGNIVSFSSLSGTAVSGVNKATKSAFLSDIYEYLIPSGTIMPFAGPESSVANLTGWLFCDGAVVSKIDYPNLYSVIGYTYGKTSIPDQFKLPDLRGRMLIGFDDMSNGLISSPGAAGRVTGANTPDSGDAFAGLVDPVTGGSEIATQVSPVTAGYGGTASNRANVMNPYMAINYIIKV